MATATIHISQRVLSMDWTPLCNWATVLVTTVDGASTTNPAGTARGVPVVTTAVISRWPPVTARCTVARGI